MEKFEFEWNIEKANQNLIKHNVSFEEAMSVWKMNMQLYSMTTKIPILKIDTFLLAIQTKIIYYLYRLPKEIINIE